MSEWRWVVGYEGCYQVSDKGEVRSVDRHVTSVIGRKRLYEGKVLRQEVTKKGYLRVDLFKNNQSSHKSVHRLVAEAFLPNPDSKETVNHKDGNRQNNDVGNLEWATFQENNSHKFSVLGNKSPRRQLSDCQVKEILASEDSSKSLSIRFGVSESVISHVKCGRTYKNVVGGGLRLSPARE